jgi:hypothetical protein
LQVQTGTQVQMTLLHRQTRTVSQRQTVSHVQLSIQGTGAMQLVVTG